MRIGRMMIDTDNMTTDELTTIINDLRKIRSRKAEAESLKRKLDELLTEAAANGFAFVETGTGMVLESSTFELYDER